MSYSKSDRSSVWGADARPERIGAAGTALSVTSRGCVGAGGGGLYQKHSVINDVGCIMGDRRACRAAPPEILCRLHETLCHKYQLSMLYLLFTFRLDIS